jgi:hypothetical protein
MSMPDLVICRSDHDYLGYPLAFYWHEQRLEVSEVLAQSRTPTGYCFRVRTTEFGIFELDFDLNTDHWSVDLI